MFYYLFISVWLCMSILTFLAWIVYTSENKFIYDQLFVLRYGKLFHKILMLMITLLFMPFTIPSLINTIKKQNKK